MVLFEKRRSGDGFFPTCELVVEISADFSGPPASAGIVPLDVRADSLGRFRTVLLQARLNFQDGAVLYR